MNILNIFHCIPFSTALFIIAIIGILINRSNIIIILMAIEIILLAVSTNFIAFSYHLNDINGQIFVFFILTIAATESAIGLAILITLIRNIGSINTRECNKLKN